MIKINVRIPDRMLTKLREIASETKQTLSDVIRQAIAEYIERSKDGQ